MLNLCCIVVAILKTATGSNFSMSGHHYLPTYQNLNFCGIVVAILKMANGRNFSMFGSQFGTSLSTHISNFDDIGQC
jgi:hypothetical protein